MRANTAEVILSRYNVNKDCWEYTGFLNEKGYGKVKLKGKHVFAHRLALCVYTGKNIKTKKHVLHTCDNPKCINPKHLYFGTNLQNVRDKMMRGRHGCEKINYCPKGHKYQKYTPYMGKRRCVECDRDRSREYQRMKRYLRKKGNICLEHR